VCRRFHNRYYTLLHTNANTQRNDRWLTNHNRSVAANVNPTAEENTYSSFNGQPQNQILLATTIVELRKISGRYTPCRALIDSPSQQYFITERCVQRLRMTKTQARSSILGIRNSSAVANHRESIHMRSRHTEWHDRFKCVVLSDITGTTPATKLDASFWRFSTDIKLAGDNFNLPGDIDLLI